MFRRKTKMRLPEMASPAHRTTSKDCSANTFQHTAGDEGNSGSIQTTDIEDCCPLGTFNYARHDQSFHEFSSEHAEVLRSMLVDWYYRMRRKLPWRGDEPPWFGDDYGESSTVIEPCPMVVAFYQRWMQRFPTIEALADADPEDVKLAWSGLGYYNRARLLQEGARKVQMAYGGSVPNDIDKLKSIPGIGPYTAGAICSIAFNKPAAAVDGNVIRVLARLCCISANPKHKPFVKHCWYLADELVKCCKDPSAFNQGLMELGATVCLPRSPKCSSCPVRMVCRAYGLTNCMNVVGTTTTATPPTGKVEVIEEEERRTEESCNICQKGHTREYQVPASVGDLPLKARKTPSRDEIFAVPIIRDLTGRWLLVKRPERGLLAGQWELPCVLLSQGGDNGSTATIPSSTTCQQKVKSLLKEIDISEHSASVVNWSEAYRIVHLFSHRRHVLLVAHVASVSSSRLTFRNDEDGDGTTKRGRTYLWMTNEDVTRTTVCLSSRKVMDYITSTMDRRKEHQLKTTKNHLQLESKVKKERKEATNISCSKCNKRTQRAHRSDGGKSQVKKTKSRLRA